MASLTGGIHLRLYLGLLLSNLVPEEVSKLPLGCSVLVHEVVQDLHVFLCQFLKYKISVQLSSGGGGDVMHVVGLVFCIPIFLLFIFFMSGEWFVHCPELYLMFNII